MITRFKIGTTHAGRVCMIATDGDTTAVIAEFAKGIPKSLVQRMIDDLNKADDERSAEPETEAQDGP